MKRKKEGEERGKVRGKGGRKPLERERKRRKERERKRERERERKKNKERESIFKPTTFSLYLA